LKQIKNNILNTKEAYLLECLKDIFGKFLEEQKERLAKRTFNKYSDVMDLFEKYLDGYAYQYLNEEEIESYKQQKFNEDTDFCEIYSIDKIKGYLLDDFMTYFMIKKVWGSKELMKNTGTVLRKFVKWLKENSYIEEEKFNDLYDLVNEKKDDLPKVEELSELLYDEGIRNSIYNYDEFEEEYFVITSIKKGELWLESFSAENKKVGPVKVSNEISSLAQVGWNVYLVLGQSGGSWFIIESGNVYPD